ncbi:MAG TPA: T9SS type A sorting domain-containing protein [Panacibacter sp.]|nr:T9SS type A sorting domain-containing protein [Panacibacter sp.]HNP43975.1 T9SS type A sorting domain-containing protein [Panacibacter sp.]
MKKIYFAFLFLLLSAIASAQFSLNAATPFGLCNDSHDQKSTRAVDDDITGSGGYFVFWLDSRSNTSNNYELYGQSLDKNGNPRWEANGRLIASSGSTITDIKVTKGPDGLLLAYVVKSDSVVCMYLDANGVNKWAAPSLVARKDGSIIYVDGGAAFNIFATSTGAGITYNITFTGGFSAIGYNKIDITGTVSFANNSKSYSLSGYDYRSVSDGADGFYALSKGNGIGSTITIDRITSSGVKAWANGVEITNGGGATGFAGNISMNVASNKDLYVTWDASGSNVYVARVSKSGSLAWNFGRVALSLSSPASAGRSNARITAADSIIVTWNENGVGATNTMIQKLGQNGNIGLPAGGKIVDVANGYYGYPKLALNGDNAVCFFSTPGKNSVAIGAQTINSDNSFKWPVTIPVTDAYLKWNFYDDYQVLDDAAGCNAIFWTGFDGNIYGANTCESEVVLPVKTGTLKAEMVGLQNKITWEGFNQSAGDLYQVQRSSNARDFTNIGTVAAKGTDNHYTWWDKQPLNGNSYYRIKLSGISGNNEYSNIVKTTAGAQPLIMISAYPNPVKNILNVQLGQMPRTNALITVSDMAGKVIRTVPANQSALSIDMSHLSKGLYFITYKDDKSKTVVKVQKD